MIYGSYGYNAKAKAFLIEISNSPSKDTTQKRANAIPHLYNAIKKHMETDDVDVWEVIVHSNVGLLKIVGVAVVQYMQGLGLENIKTIGC